MADFYIILFLGILIVVFTAFDFFYTTLSFSGAGPLTEIITDTVSSVFLFINGHTAKRTILSFSGVIHILVLTCLWIGLLWIGLFFILSSSDISIVHSFSKESATWMNRLYFSGYILSTLGNGDFIPTSGGWQMVVAIFSFSGFIFITTTISYLVNLNSAVLQKRTLSLFISNLGESAEEIIINSYSGGSFSRLIKLVPQLQQRINRINQNHYAYPLSHYFNSVSINDSLSVNLFNLDEALTIIKYQTEKNPSLEADIRPLRDAIKKFLYTIKDNFVPEFKHDKKLLPDSQKLEKHGITLIKEPDLNKQENSDIMERRYLLFGFLRSTGWNLEEIYLGHIKQPEKQQS